MTLGWEIDKYYILWQLAILAAFVLIREGFLSPSSCAGWEVLRENLLLWNKYDLIMQYESIFVYSNMSW